MPGTVAASHVQSIAAHLIRAVSHLSTTVGLTDDNAGQLTALLGVGALFDGGGFFIFGHDTSRRKVATQLEAGASQESFDRRFLRLCKLNVAEIVLAHQKQAMAMLVTSLVVLVSIDVFFCGRG